jgi:hypothetical protein
MRVVADFMIVIGAMLLTGTLSIIAIAIGHVAPQEEALLVVIVMAAMIGAGLFTTGILVHLRRWQRD